MKEIKFVGLHAHSVAGSIFDALGFPQEHMDFAYKNGCDALALTDHGNMNGLSYQVLHAKKMQAEGKNFKPIYGCEAYFIPSIEEWHQEYEKSLQDKKAAKKIKKEGQSGATVEDENATKKTQDVLRRRRHLVLLAQNQKGLNNLFKLISESYLEENYYRYPRIDFALLQKYNEGIIAASACLGGVYAGCFWENKDKGPEAILNAMREVTERMQGIFGDRWYGELQWNNVPEQHQLNQYIIQISEEYNMKLISTADSHYPNPNAWKDRELYKRLGWLGKGDWASSELPSDVEEIGYELYPKNGNQMWASYKKYSKGYDYDDTIVFDSIQETWNIAHNRIESFFPDNTVRLPSFVVPEGQTADQALAKMSLHGLFSVMGWTPKQTINDKKREYLNRLREELKIISDRGFSKYFLTMKSICDISNNMMLAGTGRGSAAGSLVAYALRITQIDPIKYGLLFSRFLRSDATDYPDIDYDVSDPMALKEELVARWGKNVVAPISNWNTLQLKSLIKDISKFYGIPFVEVNKVTDKMIKEATPLAKKRHGIKAGVYTPTWQEVMEFSETLQKYLAKYPHIKTHVEALVGQVRSCSRHAGGVVIGENLDTSMPLINSGGVRQTPWSEGQNVRHLEPMGFIKYDLLGLSTLKMMEGCIEHILKRRKNIDSPTFADIKKYYDENLHPDIINLSDKKVYKNVFHNGKWAGTFQFTEDGAQKFCERVKPDDIIEIAAITSTYRPGPLAAGVHEEYIEAKENPHKVKYINETHREITQETYGFLIFQEQIALLAHKLGDLTLDEGNLLRKILTKKGTGKDDKRSKLRTKFINGCAKKGISNNTAASMWSKFEYFSGYGFNKSHAVAYSIISYQCAWLWTYYPAEWMAALLDKEPEKKKEYAINIAKSYGFNIAPLNINKSGRVWEISEDGKILIQPLSSVKGVGDAAIDQILEHRPFTSVEHLLFTKEIAYGKLNKKVLDALCRGGALNELIDERFTGGKHFWSAAVVDRPKTKKKFLENIELYREEGEFTSDEIIQFKTELTGVFPMSLVIDTKSIKQLRQKGIPPVSEFDPDSFDPDLNSFICWFIPRKIVEKKTKKGKVYWIVEVIDSNNETTKIRCWGVNPEKDFIYINKPYMASLEYSPDWGFSTRSLYRSFRLIGINI